MSAKSRGLWNNITKAASEIHSIPTSLGDVISRKIGNGRHTKFWEDVWVGNQMLSVCYPRLYALESNKGCCIQERWDNSTWKWQWRRVIRSGTKQEQLKYMLQNLPNGFSNKDDYWSWNFDGKREFSVAQIRKYIDHQRLNVRDKATRWNKLIPRKVNLFTWRLLRNGIPTNVNLFGRGIDVMVVGCPLCSSGIDDVSHIFHTCLLMRELRSKMGLWLNHNIPDQEPKDILNWLDSLRITGLKRRIFEAIIFVWWWHVWKERNNARHNDTHENINDIFNSVVSLSFIWISSRDRKHHYVWSDWITNPLDNGC
uniref:uncharacterized protein LOC122588210 n=1 Tax=Erigeron canadensis TaxID=72917 RepID=UPI001CB9AA90|nr:uncharacterized protein LOC122588210 [Erigeron canadensis]